MTEYRENIISTYKYLISLRNELMTFAINIAMVGEMKETNDIFEVGETYNFDIEQLKGTNDINLNKMIEFYEELDKLMLSMANINAITEEDLKDEV